MIISSFFWTTFVLSDYPPFKKQKNLVAQAEYIEEAYLDFLLYCVLIDHEATIWRPWYFYQIFFIHLWNIVRKIMVSNMGLHIFFNCLLRQKMWNFENIEYDGLGAQIW